MRGFLLFVLSALFMFSPEASCQRQSSAQSVIPEQASVPAVPEYVVFAGDTVRFDRLDMRERMDRELIAFTYSHSLSLLMLKRANRYFPQIEPILREQGMPDDLKYLMVIESNLDPQAVSSAGAAGLWQFTQSTGKQYGLEVNANVDERFNTEKATVAACRFLKSAYQKYGDWLTVAASYNSGQAAVSSRLEKQHQTRAVDLWLASETSRYMFRLLVVKMMFENPSAFGFYLEADDLYPFVPARDTVYVSESVPDLVEFAGSHGVSYADLKRANLWLRESKLDDSSHRLYKIAIPDTSAMYYVPGRKPHNPAWVVK